VVETLVLVLLHSPVSKALVLHHSLCQQGFNNG
jgi:hypothetical protein